MNRPSKARSKAACSGHITKPRFSGSPMQAGMKQSFEYRPVPYMTSSGSLTEELASSNCLQHASEQLHKQLGFGRQEGMHTCSFEKAAWFMAGC